MLIFSRCLSVLALNFEFISSFNWALGIKETVTPSPLFLTVGVRLSISFLATLITGRRPREAGEACNFLLPVSSQQAWEPRWRTSP